MTGKWKGSELKANAKNKDEKLRNDGGRNR